MARIESLAVALEHTAARAIRVLFVSPNLSFATGRPDEDYRGAYRSAERFVAVGAADMSQKKKGAIRGAQVVATTEGHSRMQVSAKDDLSCLNC
jgi:hypothetical protein